MLKKISSFVVLAVLFVVGLVGSASAVITGTPADIWTAIDLTGMSTAVATSLVALVGIGLVFMAYRFGKKVMRG